MINLLKSIEIILKKKSKQSKVFIWIFLLIICNYSMYAYSNPNPLSLDLGSTINFGTLSQGAITGTGSVEGDMGSGSGAIAPAITSSGTKYPTGDPVVMTALSDYSTAYNDGKNVAYDILLSGAAYELGGNTLTQGIYRIGAAASITTPVTLDAQGNPNATFIIQVGAALGTTATNGNVILINGTLAENIYWIVEGAVTLGATTNLYGNIIGGSTISLGATITLEGRLLAGSAGGTITLATSTIKKPSDGTENLSVQNPTKVNLGTTTNFGVLSEGAITAGGFVDGDLGSGSGAIAPAITYSGTKYPTGDPKVMSALVDFETAYNDAKNRPYDYLLSAAAYELGGKTLTRGVHRVGAAASMGSPVTLDAEGDPDAVFIIQIGAALSTTATIGNVILINGTQGKNVFWIVEAAITLGATTNTEGTFLGGSTISLGATTTLNGKLFAGKTGGTITISTTTDILDINPPIINNVIINPYSPTTKQKPTLNFIINDSFSGVKNNSITVNDSFNTLFTNGDGYLVCVSNELRNEICTLSYNSTIKLPIGTYNFSINADDRAGNSAETDNSITNFKVVPIYSKFMYVDQGYWIDILTIHKDKTLNSEFCYSNNGTYNTFSTSNLPGQLYAREYVTAEPVVTINTFQDQYSKFPTNNTGLGFWSENSNPQTINLTDGETKSIYHIINSSTPFDKHYKIIGILNNKDRTSTTNLSIIDLPTNTNLFLDVTKIQTGINTFKAEIDLKNKINLDTPRFSSLFIYIYESDNITKTSSLSFSNSTSYTTSITTNNIDSGIYKGLIHTFEIIPTPSVYTTAFKPYSGLYNQTNSYYITFNYTQNKTHLDNTIIVGFDPSFIPVQIENSNSSIIFGGLLQIFIKLKSWF